MKRIVASFIVLTAVLLALVACNADQPALPTVVPVADPPEMEESSVVDAVPPADEEETAEIAVVEAEGETVVSDEAGGAQADETITEMEGEDAAATFSLNADNLYGEPAGVDSYRISLEFTAVGVDAAGNPTSGSVTAAGVRSVNSDAIRVAFEAAGTANVGSGDVLTWTRVDDTEYMELADGFCAAFPPNESENPFTVFLNTGGVIGDVAEMPLGDPATETINGVETTHYVFDETLINPGDEVAPVITAVDGHVYVANEGGFVVRVVMAGTGSSNLFDNGSAEEEITYELNFFDFNQPVTITAPAACNTAESALDETPYPLLSDAVANETSVLAGAVAYNTDASVDEAVAFYLSEMETLGYSVAQQTITAQGGAITFSGSGGNVMVTFAPDTANGNLLVSIVELP